MTIKELGFTNELESYINENQLLDFVIARVTQEHKERYVVTNGTRDFEAEITGNLRFSARSSSEFPAVGDWVACNVFDDNMCLIHQVLPRTNALERQAVGKKGDTQIISTNIDEAFILQSLDNNFNINRFERYLTICNTAKIKPVFVLSKIDLFSEDEISERLQQLDSRHPKVKVLLISNETKQGFDELQDYLQPRISYCLLGSSGVGKSSLLNNLLHAEIAKTANISTSSNKGKHTTSHRELFLLSNGAIIIDTPGMRELGITDSSDGLNDSFEEIALLAKKCKFNDCSHENENGCAVLNAIDTGDLEYATLVNYKKMEREASRFSSTVAEKRKKDKDFGKMVKSVMATKKKGKS